MTNTTKGALFVVVSVLCWAITGNLGSFLFAQKAMTPAQMITIRMLSTGIALTAYNHFRQPNPNYNIFKTPADVIRLIIFAIGGILFMQFFFFSAIQESNAPTATIMQYTGPFIVIISLSIYHRVWPRKIVLLAMLLSAIGTVLLLTHGDFSSISVTQKALFFGALSAIGYAFYNIVPIKLLLRYETPQVAGLAMLIAFVVLTVTTNPFAQSFIFDMETFLAMFFAIVMGTIFPFVAYLEGAKLIGPPKASILGSLEPLFSTLIAVFFLGAKFYPIDYVGVALVMASVIFLSLPDRHVNTEKIQ